MKKRLFFTWVLMCTALTSEAQAPINIDSLRKVLAHSAQKTPSYANDTNKVKTLIEMMNYHSMNSDSGLYYSQRVMTLAQKIKWPKGIAMAHLCFAKDNSNKNKFNEWRLSLQKAMVIAKAIKNDSLLAECYWGLAAIYGIKRNYPLSINYFELTASTYLKVKSYFEVANAYNNIGYSWLQLGNKKKAMTYFQKTLLFARQHKQELTEAFALSNIADLLKDSTGHQEEALSMIAQSIQLFKKLNRPVYLAEGLATIGQEYLEEKQYAKALPYVRQAWETFHKYNWGQELTDDNLDKNLYEIYKGLNQPAKALFHLERYNVLLDSSLKSEVKSQRDIVKIQEEKDKQQTQINLLQNKEIQQERTLQKRTQNFLWVGLGLFILTGAGLLWYNRKLRLKNKDLEEKNEIIKEVTRKIQATEITALRAQMNPHFIFNCLNSIQLFTAQNEAEKASEYLSKFSRLIRLVLENSRSEKVTLENELETLRLYIEMEAMRFKGKVAYHINIAENIDSSFIQIPPLLVQPFVENAIWHGLMHKEAGGTIGVEVTQPNENLLHIEISDDGIGREKAAEFKSKSATINKSFGMKVTNERIELINQLYNSTTKVQVFDLNNQQGEAAGTKVVVEIPI